MRTIESKNSKRSSVLFLVPSPLGISPGQRFRFEHFLPMLDDAGIRYKVSSFLSLRGRKRLYTRGNIPGKVLAMISGCGRRLGDMFTLGRYEYVYIHRWAALAGPPVFEWLIAKVFRKKIIYDFDDSIWVNESAYNKKYLAVKFLGKVFRICRWAHTVTVGNQYLYNIASNYNKNVLIIPTVVNTETVHGKNQNQVTGKPAVGWTGSFSTLIYLDIIVPVLQKLQEKIDFTFFVIADKDPHLPLKNYQFIPWNIKTETEDLLNFHIGLMPLTDDEITRGKCGFKAIQYMALGMPALASPVGINNEIINDGVNGYLCKTGEDWEQRITQLLSDPALRSRLGKAAREKVENYYSVKSVSTLFLSLFSTVVYNTAR
ncbi:MAG: glycosyltransferase [Sphingobacteriales bacterium]|nr:glycosyltransferase [Sphingobacteriales bacterium]